MMIQPLPRKKRQTGNIESAPQLILGTTGEGMQYSLTNQLFERHKWVLGVSGSGKSYFLASLICQIFALGIGLCLIDPHGDLAKLVLSLLAQYNYFSDRRAYQKLLYVDFSKAEDTAAIAFNFLKQPDPHITASRTASHLLSAIKRAFPSDSTTANLDMMLLNAGTLLAYHSLPITRLPDIVFSRQFRENLLKNIATEPQYEQVVHFFRYKFDTEKVNSQLVDSMLKRSWLLTFSPVLRNTLGQSENALDFSYLLNNQISCIFNLGGLDEETTKLLACLLTVGLEQAFLSRARLAPELRLPYHVFIDEFPLFSAQSEASFTHILEQVRKYNGVLYLANQTLGQLSPGMTSSLQNSINISMKAGYKDSNELTSNFYRPVAQKPEGVFDSILRLFGLLPDTPQSAFSGLTTKDEARAVFENLQRQEALVTVNGHTTRILTNTIPPVNVTKSLMRDIDDTYTKFLLTPLSQIHQKEKAPTIELVATPAPQARRRIANIASMRKSPVNTLVGSTGSDDDLLMLLSQYHYMTSVQVARVLKKTSSLTNIRKKLHALVTSGLAEKVTIATKSSGKPPDIFMLSVKGMRHLNEEKGLHIAIPKGERKHGYIEHTLAVNTGLINAALLPSFDPMFTLVDFCHERQLKASPLKTSIGSLIPDGYISYVLAGAPYGKKHEKVNIAFEIDRNSEEREKIQGKIQAYCSYAADNAQSLTIAFLADSEKRAQQLRSWCEEYLKDKKDFAALFLFGAPPLDLEPVELFTDDLFVSPFDTALHALIEKIS